MNVFVKSGFLPGRFVRALIPGIAVAWAACQATAAPYPGTLSDWFGFARYDFEVDGRSALVVAPKQVAPGRPWIWHGEFFGHKPNPDLALLGRGFHVVYLTVPDMLGCPEAVRH